MKSTKPAWSRRRIAVIAALSTAAMVCGVWTEVQGAGPTTSRSRVRGGYLGAFVNVSAPSTNPGWTNSTSASVNAWDEVYSQDGDKTSTLAASVDTYTVNWDSGTSVEVRAYGGGAISPDDFVPPNAPVNKPSSLTTTVPGSYQSWDWNAWAVYGGPVDIAVAASLTPGTDTVSGPFADTQSHFDAGRGGSTFYRYRSRGVGATNYDPSGVMGVAVSGIPGTLPQIEIAPDSPITGGTLSHYNNGTLTIWSN